MQVTSKRALKVETTNETKSVRSMRKKCIAEEHAKVTITAGRMHV